MFKYKYILRDDSIGNAISLKEAETESEETLERFLAHAHVVEVLEVTDLDKKEEKTVEVKKKK